MYITCTTIDIIRMYNDDPPIFYFCQVVVFGMYFVVKFFHYIKDLIEILFLIYLTTFVCYLYFEYLDHENEKGKNILFFVNKRIVDLYFFINKGIVDFINQLFY